MENDRRKQSIADCPNDGRDDWQSTDSQPGTLQGLKDIGVCTYHEPSAEVARRWEATAWSPRCHSRSGESGSVRPTVNRVLPLELGPVEDLHVIDPREVIDVRGEDRQL